MRMMAKIPARRSIARDTGGLAMVETALILPVMLFAGLGGIELANLAVAHLRVAQIAAALADNASRVSANDELPLPQIREADVNELIAAALESGKRLGLSERGRVILSSLETNPDGGQWIHWQRCGGMKQVESDFGAEGMGSSGTSFPGMGVAGRLVQAPPGGAVMVVEINHDYAPMVLGPLVGDVTIKYQTSFMVRDERDLKQIYNPDPVAPIANCVIA